MTAPPDTLFSPQVRLNGDVNDEMFAGFQEQFLAAADSHDPIVVELTTIGGDADVGRRIAAACTGSAPVAIPSSSARPRCSRPARRSWPGSAARTAGWTATAC